MSDHSGCDFAGWWADLFRPVKGCPNIMVPMTDLFRAIANRDESFPVEAFWPITPGSLVRYTNSISLPNYCARLPGLILGSGR